MSLFEFNYRTGDFEYNVSPSKVKWVYNPKPTQLPYQGNKALIVGDLLKFLITQEPQATHFIDLFGGGGSVSFYALECGFKTYYNELNCDIYTLISYLIKNKPLTNKNPLWWKFYNREEFFEWKDKSPANVDERALKAFILNTYSFGNRGTAYFYRKDLEIFKQQGHEFVVFNSPTACEFWQKYFANEFGEVIFAELHQRFENLSVRERRALWVNLVLKLSAFKATDLAKCYEVPFNVDTLLNYSGKRICQDIMKWRPDTPLKEYENSKKGSISELKQVERIEQLQQIQQIQLIEQIQRIERIQQIEQNITINENFTMTNLDYREALIKIESEGVDLSKAIILCDIPYKSTEGYKVGEFNHDEFFAWCDELNNRGVRVYFCEYNNVDYKCVFERNKRVLMSAKASLGKTTTGGGVERIYLNEKRKI